ncbi:hypothetical protein HMPREF3098_00320 [Corynebacterium sp. HMSC28B08]|nr:hypothetical protein HMPREF3098_00320 [Corynebacterium sp. HMSC28B08]
MRKYFGGAAVACVATISVVALSGCSVSLEDAMSGAETTMGDRFGESTRAREGQAHDPKGESGSSGAGTGRGTGGADDSSSGRPGAQEKGRPAGEGARPAGHEGLWFDSEPADPWDRYVWKSQKYIGKGGDIPKLGPGTADKAFWGLPDLCSRQMQLRMKDVGFEFAEVGANDSGLRDCYWSLSLTGPLESDLKTLILMYSVKPNGFSKIMGQSINWPFEHYEVVENNRHLPDFQCAAQHRLKRDTFKTFLVADMETGVSLSNACYRTAVLTQVVENIVN